MAILNYSTDPIQSKNSGGFCSYRMTTVGNKVVELWLDQPYVTWWGSIKHRLVRMDLSEGKDAETTRKRSK